MPAAPLYSDMKPQPILEPTLLSEINSVTSSNTPLLQATSTTASSTALFNETDGSRAQEIAGEAAQLEERFVNVLMHTKICFAEKEAESGTFLDRFKITLTTLPLSKKHQHLKFLKNEKERIKRARNSEEIFDILEDYWNYSDYDLLEFIIKEFGMKELQEEMDIYIAELEQFEKKTTIQDYDSASLGEMIIPEDFRTVTIEQGKDPLKCTLYDVRQFENDVVNQAALNKFALFRRSIKSSSVKVVLAFPPEAYAGLSEVFDEHYKKKHKITSVVFNQRILDEFRGVSFTLVKRRSYIGSLKEKKDILPMKSLSPPSSLYPGEPESSLPMGGSPPEYNTLKEPRSQETQESSESHPASMKVIPATVPTKPKAVHDSPQHPPGEPESYLPMGDSPPVYDTLKESEPRSQKTQESSESRPTSMKVIPATIPTEPKAVHDSPQHPPVLNLRKALNKIKKKVIRIFQEIVDYRRRKVGSDREPMQRPYKSTVFTDLVCNTL